MQQSLYHILHSRSTAALLHNEVKRYRGYLITQRHIGVFPFAFPLDALFTRHFQFGQFSGLMKMHLGRTSMKRRLVPTSSSVALLPQRQTRKIPVFLNFLFFSTNPGFISHMRDFVFFPPAVISFHISDSFSFPPVARFPSLVAAAVIVIVFGKSSPRNCRCIAPSASLEVIMRSVCFPRRQQRITGYFILFSGWRLREGLEWRFVCLYRSRRERGWRRNLEAWSNPAVSRDDLWTVAEVAGERRTTARLSSGEEQTSPVPLRRTLASIGELHPETVCSTQSV